LELQLYFKRYFTVLYWSDVIEIDELFLSVLIININSHIK